MLHRDIIVILRWMVAPIVALLAFLLVQTLFVLAWAKFGGDATGAYAFGVMFATLFAICAGVATAPRRQWRTALGVRVHCATEALRRDFKLSHYHDPTIFDLLVEAIFRPTFIGAARSE